MGKPITIQTALDAMVKRALAGSNSDRVIILHLAKKAEAELALIARTRKPTEEETAAALAKYAAAAKVSP